MKSPFISTFYLLAVVFIVVGALFLPGCSKEPKTVDITSHFVFPDDLKDCRIYELNGSGGEWIRMTRCPNSTTTSKYQTAGSPISTVVVDGVQYEPKPTVSPAISK